MMPYQRSFLAAGVAAIVAIACSDGGPGPVDNSPLRGLARVATNDSGGVAPLPPSSSPEPGHFRGTVRGYSTANGPDTLASAVKLPNVRVTAYPRLESRTDTLGVGPAAASVLTNANGEFTMPTIPGGDYVVTFNPQSPEDTQYRGGFTVTTVHAHSHEIPWYIMLPSKN